MNFQSTALPHWCHKSINFVIVVNLALYVGI